ncbi:heterokaryon incompatibility protein [Rutstroemia sp. NJR-2017a WRK4]|nr:heterokaryon incompatibility protein [Rutstroemia sp. NJR-2017a WRK4]
MAPNSIYQPLYEEYSQIRVLELLAAAPGGDNIECRLHTVSLAEKPAYAALSYVWGDPTVTESITVNGVNIKVTRSLAVALRYVMFHWQRVYQCREPQCFRLWADAICINQADVIEKGKQVQMMREIYSSAELVFSWLGEGLETVASAFEIIGKIARETKDISDELLYSLRWMESHRDLCVDDLKSGLENKAWRSTRLLLELPYWDRVWIFQEVVLARKLLLLSGNKYLDFVDLDIACFQISRLASAIQRADQDKPAHLSDSAWSAICNAVSRRYIRVLTISWAKSLAHLPSSGITWDKWRILIRAASELQASDPRDLIYGLVGITNINIPVEYTETKTVCDVFRDFVAAWLEERPKLLAQSRTPAQGAEIPELFFLPSSGLCFSAPSNAFGSWVPNYPALHTTRVRTDFRGNADYKVFPPTTPGSALRGSSLWVNGVSIDPISRRDQVLQLDHSGLSSLLDYFENYIKRRPIHTTGVSGFYALFQTSVPDRSTTSRSKHILGASAFLHIILYWAKPEPATLHRIVDLVLDNDKALSDFILDNIYKTSAAAFGRRPNLAVPPTIENSDFDDAVRDVMRVLTSVEGCRYIETASGYIGMASPEVREDDVVCVLYGCPSLVILRKTDDYFVHIGACYVPGLMNGEAAMVVPVKEARIERFELR